MIFLQRWRKKGCWCNFPNATLHQHLKRTFSSQETTFLGRPIFKGELPSFREAKSCETPTSLVHLPLPTARGLPAKDHSVHRLRSLHCRRWDLLEASDQKLPGPNDGPAFYLEKKAAAERKDVGGIHPCQAGNYLTNTLNLACFLRVGEKQQKLTNYSWARLNEYHCLGLALQNHWKKQKNHPPKWYHVACFIILGRCHRLTKKTSSPRCLEELDSTAPFGSFFTCANGWSVNHLVELQGMLRGIQEQPQRLLIQ